MKQTLKQKLGSIPLVDYIHNILVLRRAKIQIPEKPSFVNAEAVEKFFDLLEKSSFYVEYGSGGSTVAAAKLGKNFSSYESSEKFLKIVGEKIRKLGKFDPENIDLNSIYYGPTRTWGIPFPYIFNRFIFWKGMQNYSDPHWEKTKRYPDLILIDGRFRVACALKAIKSLKHQDNWVIIVDDYLDRQEYKIIEEFSDLDEILGTTAFFSKKLFVKDIDKAIISHELDFL